MGSCASSLEFAPMPICAPVARRSSITFCPAAIPAANAAVVSGDKAATSKGLPGAMPISANFVRMAFSLTGVGQNCKNKVRYVKKNQRRLHFRWKQRLHPINGRCSRWRRLAEKCGKRLHFVLGLNFLNVMEIGGIEELRASDYAHQLGFRMDHFRNPFRNLALQSSAPPP